MTPRRVAAAAVALGLLAAVPPAWCQPSAADSLFIDQWSVMHAGALWRLDIGPNMRYRLWREERPGDTLVASMGAWEVRPDGDAGALPRGDVCILPSGRRPMCSPIMLEDLGYPLELRWRFIEVDDGEMRWVAYRAGHAPWELDARSGAPRGPVYDLTAVTTRPRLLGCPVPLRLPEGASDPGRLVARMVVDVDSTSSDIELVGTPPGPVREAALETLRSCRFVPGRVSGTPVRVRVQLPVTFQR